MSYKVPKTLEIIKSPLINMKVTGNTIIFTPATPFVVTTIVSYADSIVGGLGAQVANFGFTAAAYNDTYDIYGFWPTITGNAYSFPLGITGTVEAPVVPSGVPFRINVTTADTTATTNNQYIYIIGYYL